MKMPAPRSTLGVPMQQSTIISPSLNATLATSYCLGGQYRALHVLLVVAVRMLGELR